MATTEEGPDTGKWLITYNTIVNRIQKPVEHDRMLPEVFHSLSFPLCESVVPSH